MLPNAILNKYVGESPKILAAFFRVAWKLPRAVLILDEVDLIFWTTTREQDGAGMQTLISQFISLLDDTLKTHPETIVIATSNQPRHLDPRITSRMELLEVKAPGSVEERAQIIKVWNVSALQVNNLTFRKWELQAVHFKTLSVLWNGIECTPWRD